MVMGNVRLSRRPPAVFATGFRVFMIRFDPHGAAALCAAAAPMHLPVTGACRRAANSCLVGVGDYG